MIILYYAYAGICGLKDRYCFTKATVCITAAPPTTIPHCPAPLVNATNWLNDKYLNCLTSAVPISPRFTKSGAIARRIDPSNGHLPQHPGSRPPSLHPSLPPCPGHTKSLNIFHIILSHPYHVHNPRSPAALANWPLAMIPVDTPEDQGQTLHPSNQSTKHTSHSDITHLSNWPPPHGLTSLPTTELSFDPSWIVGSPLLRAVPLQESTSIFNLDLTHQNHAYHQRVSTGPRCSSQISAHTHTTSPPLTAKYHQQSPIC